MRPAPWRRRTKRPVCGPWPTEPGRRLPMRGGSRLGRGERMRLGSASPCPHGGGCVSRRGGPLPTRPRRIGQDRRQPHRPSSAGGGARSASYGAGRGRSGAGSTGTARHHPPPGGAAHNAPGTHYQQVPSPLPFLLNATSRIHPTRAGSQRVWPRAMVAVGRTRG